MSKPIIPRYYQNDTVEAFIQFFLSLQSGIKQNACAVLPPGTGKSLIAAMLIKELYERWGVRILLLCHSSELIYQDHKKAVEYWPEGEHLFGINADQLGQRDYDSQVVFATIQSVCNNPELFFEKNKQPFNFVLVDEAQRIPESGDGQYLTLFDFLLGYNPDTRVGGLTASDWRLGTGRICKPGNILTHKIYEYPIMEAIGNGFLARPVNRATKYKIDRSKLKIVGGEYTEESVNAAYSEGDIIVNQTNEVIRTAEQEEREYWIFNCFGIKHADAVYDEVKKRGIVCDVVHSNVEKSRRRDIMTKYREKMTTAIIHVDMISLGVDFPHLDLCVMQCPTKSSERYYQKIGRVIRPTPLMCSHCGEISVVIEDNCQGCGRELGRTFQQKTAFILDQDGNVAEHGAINCDLASPDKGERQKRRNKTKECKRCEEQVALHLKICPFCDTPFPTLERENKTLQRAAHDAILVEPEWMKVKTHQFFVSIKKKLIHHHVYFVPDGKDKVTNKIGLESPDPLERKRAVGFLKYLLGYDPPSTVASFVNDGHREKIPCPVEVLVTQQTGFKRLEEYRI